MKITFTNGDIITIYNVLKNLNSRNDIVPGDSNIFWANYLNMETFKTASEKINNAVQSFLVSLYNDKNSHIVKGEDRTEQRVFNDDKIHEMNEKINKEISVLENRTMELDVESIQKESLKKMYEANAKVMTMLEMTVMNKFVEPEIEKVKGEVIE